MRTHTAPPLGPLAAKRVPGQPVKRSNMGCLVLLLLFMPVIDTYGTLLAFAVPYQWAVLVGGLCCFTCGAAGAYVSVKIKGQPWWSSCRWAIDGLIALGVPAFIALAILSRRW